MWSEHYFVVKAENADSAKDFVSKEICEADLEHEICFVLSCEEDKVVWTYEEEEEEEEDYKLINSENINKTLHGWISSDEVLLKYAFDEFSKQGFDKMPDYGWSLVRQYAEDKFRKICDRMNMDKENRSFSFEKGDQLYGDKFYERGLTDMREMQEQQGKDFVVKAVVSD